MLSEIRPALLSNPENAAARAAIDKFQAAPTKIAIQKDGELTDISRQLFLEQYGITVPAQDPKSRQLVSSSEDGEYGFVYARNKNIGQLVANGAVDLAILGTDRLVEDEVEDDVDVLVSFQDRYSWTVVLATPNDRRITDVEQIQRVATQYPITAARYFASLAMNEVEVIQTAGSTELFPYFYFGKTAIDAIIDLSVSGESLAAHNLTPWTPAVEEVYPVLIRAQKGK